jgi:hypothetical protein
MHVRHLLQPATGLFLLFWLLILLILRTQAFDDPGALWHVRVGDHIFEHGFPHTDPFTWAYADRPWIPQQWGAECMLSLAHRVGGFDTMLLLMATLLAAFAAWVGKRFIDSGLHWSLAAALVGIGMAAAAFHFYLRPHLATIVLMGVVMGLLVDFERGKVGVGRWLWLIPLCVFWTNLHGGVLGGVVTMGLALGGWALLWLVGKESPIRSGGNVFALGAIIVACGLTTLVNPFGLEMLRTWWSIVGSTELPKYISEHQPLNPAATDGQAILGFAVFYILMLAGTFPKRPRVTWLLPLVWFALACRSIRHGPLFCTTALVALADLFPYTVWFRLLKKHGDTLVRDPSPESERSGWGGWVLPALAVLGALGLQAGRVPVPVVGYGWAALSPKGHPVDLIEPLRDYARSKPTGYPIFNDPNLGGFLIYFTPELRVFMDDRCELYGDAGIRDYVDLAQEHPERIDEWLQRAPAPIERLLVTPDTPMARWLKQEAGRFHEVARCKQAVLFELVR